MAKVEVTEEEEDMKHREEAHQAYFLELSLTGIILLKKICFVLAREYAATV